MLRFSRTIAFFAAVLCVMVTFTSAASARSRLGVGIWHDWSQDTVPALVQRFQEIYPEVDVELQVIAGPDFGKDKLLVQIAAGTAPDVFEGAFDHVAANLLQPVNQYLSQSQAVADLKKKGGMPWRMFEVGVGDSTFNGKNYLVPTLRYYPVIGTWMNVDLLNESGVAVLSPNRSPSWDEMATYHRKLTRMDEKGQMMQVGVFLNMLWHYMPNRLANSFNVEIVDVQANRTTLANLTEGIEFILDNFVKPYGQNSMYNPGSLGLLLENRRAAMKIANVVEASRVRQLGLTDELQATWFPTLNGERQHYLGGQEWGLVVGAKNVADAYRFFDLTITALDWQQTHFSKYSSAGAHAMTLAVTDPTWRGLNREPGVEWFYASLPNTQRFWNDSFWHYEGIEAIQDVWIMGDYKARNLTARTTTVTRQVLEEADRLIRVRLESSR